MKYCLSCVSCHKEYKGDEIRYRCDCGELLEVKQDFSSIKKSIHLSLFDKRISSSPFPYQSGVWRYKELLLPIATEHIVSKPEGNTNLYAVGKTSGSGYGKIGAYIGLEQVYLKHEGENPTGSFKDRGMSVGVSVAKSLGQQSVACASTGNTAASLASYAAQAGMHCFVFIPQGKISPSKLSQSLAYGAQVVQMKGDFDQAMQLVEHVCKTFGIYLLNSINPFRIEGQKTIIFEILQQLHWRVPDWIVLPAGNLGNTSAIGKGLLELFALGLIKKLPHIASIQAHGANPFYRSFRKNFEKRFTVSAKTVASAIQIGNPVSFVRAKRVIQESHGVVEEVTDEQILEAKTIIDHSGIGCEPASAATVAGMKILVRKKIIRPTDVVVGLLTGHILKDPDTTMQYHRSSIISGKPTIKEVRTIIGARI